MEQAVDVGASEPARARAVHDLDAPRVIDRELIGNRSRAVRRSVVDDEQPATVVLEDARREQREIFAFVIRRRDDEYVHALL